MSHPLSVWSSEQLLGALHEDNGFFGYSVEWLVRPDQPFHILARILLSCYQRRFFVDLERECWMSRTVITYGTFDMFHIGHLRLLKRMHEMGERLIVGLSTDEFNALKGKKALVPYEERREIVEAIGFVDLVIPERSWEQKVEDIRQHNVDCFVMGNDWAGQFDDLKELCEVVYLERTRGVSSTELRQTLGRLVSDELEIAHVLQLLKSMHANLE